MSATFQSTKPDAETIDAICTKVRELLQSDSFSLHVHNHLMEVPGGSNFIQHRIFGTTIVVSNYQAAGPVCESALGGLDANRRMMQ